MERSSYVNISVQKMTRKITLISDQEVAFPKNQSHELKMQTDLTLTMYCYFYKENERANTVLPQHATYFSQNTEYTVNINACYISQ